MRLNKMLEENRVRYDLDSPTVSVTYYHSDLVCYHSDVIAIVDVYLDVLLSDTSLNISITIIQCTSVVLEYCCPCVYCYHCSPSYYYCSIIISPTPTG